MMEFFKKQEEKITCLLCAHYCKLKEGQIGICGVNQNINAQLINLVYARPIALHIDPIEKKPLYHFLPESLTLSLGTIGCNFHCSFCQNWNISQEKSINEQIKVEPKKIVEMAKNNACKSIAFTYNEPIIFYPYARAIAKLAHEEGLKTIFVTNGFMTKEIRKDMALHIDAFNIDLKSFSPKHYKKKLGGSLEVVLDNLKYLKSQGSWIEITTLIVPNQNDSQEELFDIASFIRDELGTQTPWHISAFHPDYKEMHLPPTSLQTLELAKEIGENLGLEYIYIGNARKNNITRCSTCKETLIERERFSIIENNLEKGKCPICKTKLVGVYDEQ